jgi:hypothetical protein
MSNSGYAKNKDQQFYAYYDFIEETGEVIYCGKGTEYRSNIKRSYKRNKLYNDYTKNKKVNRVIIPTLDEDLAFKLEDWLMEHYHTWIDDPLATKHACNIDGPGTNLGGKSMAQSSKQKLREKALKQVPMNDEAREKCRQASLRRPPFTQESKNKMSESAKKRKRLPVTQITRIRLSESHYKSIRQINIITNEELCCKSVKEMVELTGFPGSSITSAARYNLLYRKTYRYQYL